MEDWSGAPVFGVRTEGDPWVVRPSAYGVVQDARGWVALVCTPQGVFLPGGGQEAGETPEDAVRREALEECGLSIRLSSWGTRAVQFIYSSQERAHFQKLSTFLGAMAEGLAASPLETDHELAWSEPETAARILSHESHRWAVDLWRRR